MKLCISHLDSLQPQQLELPPRNQLASFWHIEHDQSSVIHFLHPGISQSTFLKIGESFACTIIALMMARLLIFCLYNNAAVNEPSDPVLQIIICTAILVGNSVYHHVTRGETTLFSVQGAIDWMMYPNDAIVRSCEGIDSPLSFTNENPQEPQSSLSYHLGRLPHEASNIAALVITNHMTMCFVARDGKLFVLDSHLHLPYGGAMIGVSDMSGIESLLANIKEILNLQENTCSVAFVEFPVTGDQFFYMFSQQEVSSNLVGVLDLCLEMSGGSQNLIDFDFLYEEIYKLGYTGLFDVFLTLRIIWVSRVPYRSRRVLASRPKPEETP